jgi:hypothetical protein
MIRLLYRCLLRMHPVAFRESFAAEMLAIFDDSESGRVSLLVDGLLSIARQWLLRNDAPWKFLLACWAASLELAGVALLWWRAGQ